MNELLDIVFSCLLLSCAYIAISACMAVLMERWGIWEQFVQAFCSFFENIKNGFWRIFGVDW